MTAERPIAIPESPIFERIDPMLPRETRRPPLTRDWFVEIKWNGMRAVIYLERETKKPQIRSKTHRDISHAFPEINPGLTELARRHSLVLDGEIVYDEGKTKAQMATANGRSRRGLFSVREGAEKYPCRFIPFDLLYLDGQDLTSVPLRSRLGKLDRVISRSIREKFGLSPTVRMEAANLQAAKEINPNLYGQLGQYEGLVFKRKNGLYAPGLTSDWLKFKFSK